jgi:DNA-binding NarL/FixJ family response regulator
MQTQHHPLAGALAAFVVAAEGVSAGRIRDSLEREGFQLALEWGQLDELGRRRRAHVDLVIVIEGEWEVIDDQALADARKLVPHARFLVVCSPQRERPRTLLWHGIEGVVVGPGGEAVIGPIARAVLGGYLVAPAELRLAVALPPLSVRDREILDLIVDGLTNREIAQRLYLAESTVKRHVSTLFRRLGVKSRSEAVSAALAAAPPSPQRASDGASGALSPRPDEPRRRSAP